MSNDPAFIETEQAQRWAISIKTLQRWRCENRGPRYTKLSKVVRYRLADILDYEQAQRQGDPVRDTLPPLPSSAPAPEPAPDPEPTRAEPTRYTLKKAFALIAKYGSLQAAEAALEGATDESRG
jgi:hypothetical protein